MFVDLVAGGDIVMHRHHKMNGPVVITNPLSTYGFRKFHHCGFYVDQFEGNSILLEELLNVINDMKYFDDISIAKKIFNESANPDLSFNRYMISHANIVKKCKTALPILKNITVQITQQINKALEYNLDATNKNKHTYTLLRSNENVQPQILHTDMPYDKTYDQQVLVILALENVTNLRVASTSHSFGRFQELMDGRKYFKTQIIELKKGQFIVMNPKMVHSGWYSKSINTRIHWYIGLTKLHRSKVRNKTFPLSSAEEHLFDGTNQRELIENLHTNRKKKQNQNAKRISTIRKFSWKTVGRIEA